jgi:hypothetical protein
VKTTGISPLRLGIAGILCYVGSIAWVAVSAYMRHRNDPPGWVFNHPNPAGAYYLEGFGGFLILCAVFLALILWIRRSIFR